eukprot:PITA_36596
MDVMVEEHDSIMKNNVEGIDYDETFAPVARYSSIRLILALSTQMGWKIHQMDVKTTFLNGEFEEEDRQLFHWVRFTKIEADANLYHIIVDGKLLIIVLYVDDLILIGDDELIKPCKKDLAREFDMKDMGLMHYFLGFEVWQRDGEVFVSQGNYANEILRCFHMDMCKPMEIPLAGNWRKEDATSGEIVAAIVYW